MKLNLQFIILFTNFLCTKLNELIFLFNYRLLILLILIILIFYNFNRSNRDQKYN